MIGRAERVLVLDHDAALCSAACFLLRGAGFDARPHGDPEVFLGRLRREGAVAAIVDVDVLDGQRRSIAERVRAERGLARCVVVGVSRDVESIDLDAVDFALGKPYASADLPRVLRALIDVAREDELQPVG